ncbi:MAG: quinone oxidoreductase [Phycisphaerales bacterium]|nr:quinone oxidoreductase [Phycisphaerales bacterium]
MAVKVQVIFYSLYGHVWKLAEAIAEGARSVPGAEVELLQVPELLPADIIAKMGATEAKKAFAHVPIADPQKLTDADVLIFGTGTRYGMPTAQLASFFAATGGLWQKGALIGKTGGVFSSTASQHGGQETTLVGMMNFLYHQGMVAVGVPYGAQELLNMKEITGGTPYGSTTVTSADGSRLPSENELAIARFQGKHTTEVGAKVAGK